MKSIQYSVLFVSYLMCSAVLAQQPAHEKGYFQVELEKFSPPIQDQVRSFEGFPAEPFIANDMKGEEQSLSDLRGQTVVLFFWQIESADAVTMLHDLNQLKRAYGDQIEIIAMSYDTREEVSSYLGDNDTDLVIIPNTEPLSEAVYGHEMGCPRVFIIDASGIIRTVIPQDYFDEHSDHKGILDSAIRGYVE